jgi:uncharacterized protein YegP (UPF0339 family)
MIESMQDEVEEFDVTEDDFDAMLAESEPVEIIGPPASIHAVRFELISGSLQSCRWRLVTSNGEILATSDTSYRSAADARRALSSLTVAMQSAPIVDTREDTANLRSVG